LSPALLVLAGKIYKYTVNFLFLPWFFLQQCNINLCMYPIQLHYHFNLIFKFKPIATLGEVRNLENVLITYSPQKSWESCVQSLLSSWTLPFPGHYPSKLGPITLIFSLYLSLQLTFCILHKF
jgi:hypothetical protein